MTLIGTTTLRLFLMLSFVILLLLLLPVASSTTTTTSTTTNNITTTTNYDDIAHQYHTIKGNVIKKYSEEYTVLQHLLQHQQQQKEANDKNASNNKTTTTPSIMMIDRLLDLGCGDGHYTRLFRQHGLAKTIVGVDASAKMLQRAMEMDKVVGVPSNDESHIIYQLGNVLDEGGLGDLNGKKSFDLVVAIYLIPYATNRHELEHMMRTIYQALAPGGRFYTVLLNPNMTREAVEVQKAYGAEIIPTTRAAAVGTATASSVDAAAASNDPQQDMAPPWSDGTQLQMKLSHGSDFIVKFVNYYWTQTTLEHVLVQVGFESESIAWRPMQLDPVGRQELGGRFWEPYMQHPAIMALQCTKPRTGSPATSPAAVTKDDDTHDDSVASKEEL